MLKTKLSLKENTRLTNGALYLSANSLVLFVCASAVLHACMSLKRAM